MNTGFKNLDKVFNIEQAQLVLLTGNTMVNMLSGDIANNICLHQEGNFGVLEVVSCNKEYLIKRMCVNEADVEYNMWTVKNKYSENELINIGKKMVNLIEVTQKLPTIIERVLYPDKQLEKIIYKYVNWNADRNDIRTAVIIDIGLFNYCHFNKLWKNKFERNRVIGFVKKMKRYAKKYNCPIIMVCSSNEAYQRTGKYADRVIRCGSWSADGIFDVEIVENKAVVGECSLRYNWGRRRFEDSV